MLEGTPPKQDIIGDESDDDDFGSLDLTPRKKGNDFEKDSIIWAPWRHEYWPALVRGVIEQKRKLWVVFVDSPCDLRGKESRFKMDMKKVLKFDGSPKSKELYRNGMKTGERSLKDAIEKSQRYLYKKGDGKLFVNPIEFIKDPKSNFLANNKPEKRSSEECATKEQESASDSDPESYVPLSMVKRRMAAKRVKTRTEKEEKFSESIINIIESRECRDYLLGVINGTNESKRNKWFKSVTPSDQRLLRFYRYWHILTTKQLDQVICSLRRFMEAKCKVPRNYVVDYPAYVWMPEALVFALQNLLNVTKEQAEISLLTGNLPSDNGSISATQERE